MHLHTLLLTYIDIDAELIMTGSSGFVPSLSQTACFYPNPGPSHAPFWSESYVDSWESSLQLYKA